MIAAQIEPSAHHRRSEAAKVVYSLDSRSSLELDLGSILVEGELPIFKEVEDLGLLFLKFQRKKIVITAGGYIGLIPLTPSITIEVNPKLPVRNLARVIDVARAPLKSLKSADRLYRAEEGTTGHIFQFLVANFVDAVAPLQLHGVHKDYIQISSETSHPSGRINVSGSLQKFWSKGQNHKLLIDRFDQSSNIAVNRVIKEALIFVLERMSSNANGAPDLVAKANATLSNLPASIGRLLSSDLSKVKEIVRRRSMPSQRDYYYRALEAAILIISNGGVALQARGTDITLKSFIVNFDDLFENYIRHVLQSTSGNETKVLDGNYEGKRPLFKDKKAPPAQPDIVIRSRTSKRSVVADVKYRDSVKREDINQAVTYANTYETTTTVIIHQMRIGSAPGLHHLGTVGSIAVKAYAFNLDSTDLEAEERNFVEAMFSLVN